MYVYVCVVDVGGEFMVLCGLAVVTCMRGRYGGYEDEEQQN